MSRSSPFLVTRIILQGEGNRGERLPVLLRRSTRVPLELPMTWILSVRRSAPVSSNTMERELRHLGLLEYWFETERRTKGSVAAEKLDLLNPLDFIDSFTPGRIENSLRPWFGRDESDKKVKKLAVHNEEIVERLTVASKYVDWVLENAQRELSIRTQYTQAMAFNAARASIKKTFERLMPTQSTSSKKQGLAKQDVYKLISLIEPKNPNNVWARGNSETAIGLRCRNQLIVTLMLAFGPRRGDVLKLHTADVKTHGREPELWIQRRPDDPKDPRLWEPNSKTEERILPLDPALATLFDDYVLKFRVLIPGYKKTPYLILASDGRPLSTRSLNEIFEALKPEFPGMHPHMLRHTHNDRLREFCRLEGMDDKTAEDHAKYLNGWVGDNRNTYTKRAARIEAQNLSKRVQRDLFSTNEDMPF